MVRKKLDNLSISDLEYLKKVLKAEFRKQSDYATVFKGKNHYDPGVKTEILVKLLDAVHSQQKLLNMPKW